MIMSICKSRRGGGIVKRWRAGPGPDRIGGRDIPPPAEGDRMDTDDRSGELIIRIVRQLAAMTPDEVADICAYLATASPREIERRAPGFYFDDESRWPLVALAIGLSRRRP
jgi:hypothetical protein